MIFVGTMIYEYYVTGNLQDSISLYERNLDEAERMRDSLVIVADRYSQAFSDIYQLDNLVAYRYENALITEEEANTTMFGARESIISIMPLVYGNIMEWDENHTGAFEPASVSPARNKIYNPTKTGAYIVKPGFEWVFSEQAVSIGWLPRFYDEIASVDPKFASWTNWRMAGAFRYVHTEEVMTNLWQTWAVSIDRVDFSLNWFYWEVDFDSFDDYVSQNYLVPKQVLDSQLNGMLNATMATTIGILLLGFLVDFQERSKWVWFYGLMVFITLVFNIYILLQRMGFAI
jgi:hypothetical protein